MMNRQIALIALVLTFVLLGCTSYQAQEKVNIGRKPLSPQNKIATKESANYRVKRIADGDTITVVTANGANIKVRFSCVDAPEVPHSKKERESYNPSDLDQFKWGRLARDMVTRLIKQAGNRVSLNVIDTDRYGRSVAEVRLPDGTLVQEVLAREGLVMVYRQYIKDCPSAAVVEQAENRARNKKVGIWGDSQFTPPWEWRHYKN